MPNTKISLENKRTYLIGVQYINGAWSMTDRTTGEVKEGISDKWVLSFVCPLDPFKNNSKYVNGNGVFTVDVKNDQISYLFGLMPEHFNPEVFNDYIGFPCYLDYDLNSKKLRGITKAAN